MSFLKKQAGPAFYTLSDAAAVKDFVKLEGEKDVVGAQCHDGTGMTAVLSYLAIQAQC